MSKRNHYITIKLRSRSNSLFRKFYAGAKSLCVYTTVFLLRYKFECHRNHCMNCYYTYWKTNELPFHCKKPHSISLIRAWDIYENINILNTSVYILHKTRIQVPQCFAVYIYRGNSEFETNEFFGFIHPLR